MGLVLVDIILVRASGFLVASLVFFAQRFGLELVPVAFKVLKFDGLSSDRLLCREVSVLEDDGGGGPFGWIVAEHHRQKVKSRRSQSLFVLVGKHVRFPLRRAQQLEPGHLDNVRPIRSRRRAQDVVDLVELVDLPAVTGEDGVLGEDLDEHARGAPYVDRRAVLSLAEQQLRRSIPDGDHTVGVVQLSILAKEASKAKIGELELAFVADQDVGCLDVTVEDSATMQVVQSLEQLSRQVLLVRRVQLERRMVEKAGEIVRDVFKDHEAVIPLDHDLEEPDNVRVPQRLQKFDLSDGGDGEPVSFALHPDLLEGNHLLGVDVDGLEDLAVRARANNGLVARFSVVDGL